MSPHVFSFVNGKLRFLGHAQGWALVNYPGTVESVRSNSREEDSILGGYNDEQDERLFRREPCVYPRAVDYSCVRMSPLPCALYEPGSRVIVTHEKFLDQFTLRIPTPK